jgi:hypothetical protein
MTRRSWHEPQTVGTEGLPMFSDALSAPPQHKGTRTAPKPRKSGLEATAAKHARDIERLVPLALELAAKAECITVSNLRIAAVQRGLLTGEEEGRRLSFLGAVMKAAGLEQTGNFRRSDVPKSHGNLLAEWRLPPFGRAPKGATVRDNVA